MSSQEWYVYILRCGDNTLYTGVTTDCSRRLHEHNHLRSGARYTRARRPVTLVYHERAADRSAAQRREAAIRRLSAPQKEHLIASQGSARRLDLPPDSLHHRPFAPHHNADGNNDE